MAQPADHISGTVVDPSNKPVPGAKIVCRTLTAITDSEGHFSFATDEACNASVQKIGFPTADSKLIAASDNRITLELPTISEQVIVTATRTPTPIEQTGVAANVITRQDFEDRQLPRVFDLLREVPGLTVVQTSRNGGITSLFTRGSNSNGTIVLLDGVPLNDPGGSIDFAHISSAGIERMEVIRTPESVLFGASGSSAAVQLFTQRGDPEARYPHGEVTYQRGSFQTDRWSANLNGGIGSRLDYSLIGDQYHTVGEYPNDYDRVTTGSVNLGFRISPATQFRGVFRSFDSIAGAPNQVAYHIYDFDSNSEDRDSAISLRLDDTRGSHYTQRVSFGYHRLRDRYNSDVFEGPYDIAALLRTEEGTIPRVYFAGLVNPASPPASLPPAYSYVHPDPISLYPFPGLSITDRTSAGYQGTYSHTGGTLTFGYDYERQAGAISATDVERHNNGGFVHEQYNFGQRIFLTGGARLERSSTFGNKFTPRGAVTFLLFKEHGFLNSTLLRFSAGRGINEPTLIENFARESFYVGNPALRPEKTTSYETGLVQDWFGNRLHTEVSVFRNSFEDLISYVSLPYPAPGTWENIQKSWARGAELSGSLRLLRYVHLNGQYTFVATKITASTSPDSLVTGIGRELLRRPRNSGSVTLSIAPRRFSIVAGGRFTGERQDSDFLFGVNRNPGYQSVFVSASYLATKHIAPFLRIDNLLDSHYEEVLGYPALSRYAIGGIRVEW